MMTFADNEHIAVEASFHNDGRIGNVLLKDLESANNISNTANEICTTNAELDALVKDLNGNLSGEIEEVKFNFELKLGERIEHLQTEFEQKLKEEIDELKDAVFTELADAKEFLSTNTDEVSHELVLLKCELGSLCTCPCPCLCPCP